MNAMTGTIVQTAAWSPARTYALEAKYEFLKVLRMPGYAIPSIAFPAMFYLLFGAAALHPSMRVLEQPTPQVEPQHPRRRIFLLAGASLVSPAVRFIESLRHDVIASPVLAASSAISGRQSAA